MELVDLISSPESELMLQYADALLIAGRTEEAAAVAQKRADWGVTIETVAKASGLRFRPLQSEHYDFVVPAARWDRPAVRALRRALSPDSPVRARLEEMGFRSPETDP